IQLKAAWGTDFGALLERLTSFDTGESLLLYVGARGSRVKAVADERTNRVILKGEKSARARIRELVEKLDTPSEGSTGSTQVIYLRYADAKKIAEILTSLVSKTSQKGSASASKGGAGKSA